MSGTKIANARPGSGGKVPGGGRGNERKKFLRALWVEEAAKTEVETERRIRRSLVVKRRWMRETMRFC